MESNNKLWSLLTLMAGVAVGVNWPKIRKCVRPRIKFLRKRVTKTFEPLKERAEELAEKAVSLVKKPKKAAAKAK